MARQALVHSLLAAVVALSTCGVSAGGDHEPVSVVLKYQVDATAAASVGANNMNELMRYLVTAINDRLKGRGVARSAGTGLVEVDVYGKLNKTQLDLLKRRISSMGKLEFRITADPEWSEDEPIIDKARLLPPDKNDVEIDGEKMAEWVPYSVAEFGPPDRPEPGLVKRSAGGVPQSLVLMDPWNVTGEYLTSVTKGRNGRGDPAVNFSLDAQGAARFRQLISKNKPSSITGAFRHLGMLFDSRLISTPIIRTTAIAHGQISGRAMSDAEVDLIIDILRCGRLPVPIRLVSEKSAEK